MQIIRAASAPLAALATLAVPSTAIAQDRPRPDIVVTGERDDPADIAAEIERIPGAAEIVSANDYDDTPVQHIRDLLTYVPGVITQARMGDDARVSIRGSGLSRAYGNRGISMFLDGIPLNTADGLLDFFEIDPSAYARVEIYKGANALRYGSNALGGAINLVTPLGRDDAGVRARVDGGSFGYLKGQASIAGASGNIDYFATASAQTIDGYREHSDGTALRGALNVGVQLTLNLETRVYLYGASTEQRIPGEVSKAQALNAPRSANPGWVVQDQQRNVDSIRVANKTILRLDATTLEFGLFFNARHVDHPIFQYLDFTVEDRGGFARAVDDRLIGGMRNRLVVGATLHDGANDTEQFVNLPGAQKGALVSSYVDRSSNLSLYAENSLFVRPDLAVIAGVQFLHASRERQDRFLSNGDQSGRRDYDLWSPRFGLLWDVRPDVQIFGNVSRSAEVPTFDANSFATPAASNLRPQRATTYEIGTRGRSGAVAWDLAIYRAEINDELQCLTTGPFSACSVINVDRTVHQGVEAGLDAAIPLSAGGDSLALRAAYTYNDFYFDDDARYGDNRLPGVPEHLLRAEALYRHKSGVYAGPNVEWSPASYFADNANSLSVDPFTLLNLRVGYEGERWGAYVEARNVTDERYISTVAIAGTASPGAEIFNPGTGRAVFAGVRARF